MKLSRFQVVLGTYEYRTSYEASYEYIVIEKILVF